MNVLVYDPTDHFDARGFAAAFPDCTIHATQQMVDAIAVAPHCEVLIALAHEVSDPLLAVMPRLRWIAALSTGVDHLWTLKNLREDVCVTNGRGIHGPQMAELAFLFMMGLARDWPRLHANQRAHVWQRWPQPVLAGKTALILGVGLISEALARRCQAFDMNVLGVSDARTEAEGFDRLYPRAQMLDVVPEADFVIVLVPLDASTRHMIGAEVFAAMKPSAILINLARGDVVDEAALIEALRMHRIAGAGLDVFSTEPLPADHPLWDMPHVMISPRIGGMSDIYAQQILPLVVHNMQAFREGRMQGMRNRVR